ncbi:head-tail connector protein [Rhodoblastus sp.]|uniref:head-tail connector protein n=1 Tax=Rhodoblastus sp. TaxID=1962975 RepID=UPI003F96D584
MALGDLISLAQLKAHLGVQSNGDDVVLSALISQISRAIASYVNRPFIWPRDVVDVFDGNGRDRMQLRHWPVVSVSSVSVNGLIVPPAPTPQSVGWPLEPSDLEPPGAMQQVMLLGRAFPRGWQNVSIVYRAGYQVSDETIAVPAAVPYFIQATQPYGAFVCDMGVAYADGVALTAVAENPAQGQYVLDGVGGYYFSAADASQTLVLNYGYSPSDLALCALDWAADRYRYRERIGMTSKSLGGQETAAFHIAAMPDFVARSLRNFIRIIAN